MFASCFSFGSRYYSGAVDTCNLISTHAIARIDAAKLSMVPQAYGFVLPFANAVAAAFLEFAADVAGVAIGKVGALHHQDVGDAFDRINLRLSAPRAAVSVAARESISATPSCGVRRTQAPMPQP